MDASALLLGKLIITAQNTCSMNSKVYTTHFISVVMENYRKMIIDGITDSRNAREELRGTNLLTIDVCPR